MRRLYHVVSPVLAACVAASFVAAAAASPAGDGVPFRGQIALVSQGGQGPIAQCGAAPNVGYTATYAGTGTHLGTIAATETVCLEFTRFVPPDLPYTVHETLQAANGDTISILDTGKYNVGTHAFTEGGFTILGGTGRFLHAHGGGSAVPSADGSGNVTGVAFTGTLFYAASDRSG